MELKNLLGYKEFVEKDIRKFDVSETPRSTSSKDVLSADQKVVTKDGADEMDDNEFKSTFKAKKTAKTETGKDAVTEAKKDEEETCKTCKCKECGEEFSEEDFKCDCKRCEKCCDCKPKEE